MSFDQVHLGGSVATEGSGGEEQPSTAPPDASSLASSFLQHGFMTKSILEGAQRPKDLAAGSNHPPPHRMLRHSQARSSSMDLRPSPSWRERSDRRIWWRGASYYSPPPPDASSLAALNHAVFKTRHSSSDVSPVSVDWLSLRPFCISPIANSIPSMTFCSPWITKNVHATTTNTITAPTDTRRSSIKNLVTTYTAATNNINVTTKPAIPTSSLISSFFINYTSIVRFFCVTRESCIYTALSYDCVASSRTLKSNTS
ncbi:MAG: hypothetical protein FWF18_02595 [Dehalococcoidia bacterium]|nr:hypothetical protein [Dehalococcoidia bacterium]